MNHRFPFRVWSPAEASGEAAPAETPPPTEETAPTAQEAATEAQPKPLTIEEIEERAYRATQRAMAEIRAQDEQSRREAQAKQLETQRRASGQVNPTQEALDALDLRQEMYEQALDLHPDLPAEARQQLKQDLRNFKTLDALQGARNGKLHVKLADAAAGEAIRSGKYAPKSVQAPAREPVGDPKPARQERPSIPESYRRQVAALGMTLTDEELSQAYELDSQGGW